MTSALGNIEHVIVLMFENRSFDHLLGAMPGCDGVLDGNGLAPGFDPRPLGQHLTCRHITPRDFHERIEKRGTLDSNSKSSVESRRMRGAAVPKLSLAKPTDC
jgi:hypothetical protein